MIILVNEVMKVIEINPQEVRDTFQITQKKLAQDECKKQVIEVNLVLKITKAQLEVIDVTPLSLSYLYLISILVERDKNKIWNN
jgi:hypothetical protein